MRKNKISKIKQIPFKRKKQFNRSKILFKYGDKGLFTRFQMRIEKIYLKIIRKIIKKKARKRTKKLKIHNRYWIRFSQNLLLTKKSKNARMGSGKGKYLRACFVIKKNQSLIEFKNFDYFYLCSLKKRIHFKINITLMVLAKNFKKLTKA